MQHGSDPATRPRFGKAERLCAEALIEHALEEDLAEVGDLTGDALIPEDALGQARFVSRVPGVIAGLPVLSLLAHQCDLIEGHAASVPDGASVSAGQEVARLRGRMRALLLLERTALNFLQHLSGIATLTRQFVEATDGSPGEILDTRKTTPGWRALEKYAVRCGGGVNHRIGLYDAVLIKDNHLAWIQQGSDEPVAEAIRRARAHVGSEIVVEVEVDTLSQFDEALDESPDIILLDNFPLEDLAAAVERRDRFAPHIRLEASGGITLETLPAIAATGIDRISVGALTHSAPALDIGLDYYVENP